MERLESYGIGLLVQIENEYKYKYRPSSVVDIDDLSEDETFNIELQQARVIIYED